MVRIYANSVEKRKKNINQVPVNLRKQVRELVESEGYVIDSDGWASKDGLFDVDVTE